MSFDWQDYLTLAEALVRERGYLALEDACLRSAISRAYYAAFVSARNFATARDGFIPCHTGADHGRVKKHFKRSSDRARRQVGVELGRIWGHRTSADYDDVFQGALPAATQASLQHARNVLSTLSTIA
jgi:uncharacterized protein (UPF0332 family)